MTEVAAHRPGSFCTSVLRTRDPERAAAFYGELIGWTSRHVPGAPHHRLVEFNGHSVANLQLSATGEDVWVPHVCVADVDTAAASAVALDAAVVDRTDVPGIARLATLRDFEGTLFGLWQPAPHPGALLMDAVGSLWWIEVLANDVARAGDFYGRLFGWTVHTTSFAPFNAYIVFKRGEVQEAGMLPIGPEWNISPRWNSIFAVEDCDATARRAEQLGGCEIFVHTVPKHGRIGVLSDPGGALFVVRGPVP